MIILGDPSDSDPNYVANVSTGGNFGGSVNASESSSESQSTQYVNSSLSGGSIVSNSDSLTIAGGNLSSSESGGEIDITTNTLVVTSLQDTSSSSNESQGANIGFGGSSSTDKKTGETSTSGSLSSVGINASQGESSSAWVSQQSGITGGTVNITAKDTSITGATIAAVDENGNTTDNLTLTTDTLTVANLEDSDTSKQMGIDLSTGGGSTTIGGNFSGHEKEQLTSATIGLGNVTVGGESIDEQAEFADLNRDVATSQEITKDMERGGLDASLTVDHRVLTEAGRDKIAEDIMKSGMLVDTAVLAATTDRVSLLDFNEELGKTHTVYETVKTEIAKDANLAAQLQDPNLSAADKEVMLDQLTHAVMEELGYETEGYENKIIADKTAVGSYEYGVEGAVLGFHSDQTGDSYINDANIENTEGLVNTVGHESAHEMDAQDGTDYSQSDNEAYANNFGSNLASYTDLALDINGYDAGMATTNNHVGNTSQDVLDNTKEYQGLDKDEGDFRLLNISRSVDIFSQPSGYEHAASVIVRDDSSEFSDEDIAQFGEPVEIEGEGVGYVFEALNIPLIDPETGESVPTLVPVVNGRYLSNGEYMDGPGIVENGEPKTFTAIKNDEHIVRTDRDDNIESENSLMQFYHEDMTTPENWTNYPTPLETLTCAAIDCSGDNQIYNSNSYDYDAQVEADLAPSGVGVGDLLPGHPNHTPTLELKGVEMSNYISDGIEEVESLLTRELMQ